MLGGDLPDQKAADRGRSPAVDAFERHRLNGKHFSSEEIGVIRGLIDGKPNPLDGLKRKEFDEKLFGKTF